MKNAIKKIVCTLLAVILSVSVFSCGNGNKEQTPYVPDKANGRNQTITDTDVFLTEPDGTTDYAILLPAEFTPTHSYAASEIQQRVYDASNVMLPVVYESETDIGDNTKFISLGATSIADASGITYTRGDLTRNGFRIESYKDAVLIVAPNTSGILYGSYRFLEEQIDYMYYAPTEIRTGDYKTTGIKLKNFKYEDWPDFLNRYVYNYDTLQDPQNAARLYNNGYDATAGGGKYGEGTWWASLHDQSLALQIIPYDVYRASHPDWYVGGVGGSGATNPQICYTKVLYSKDEYEKGDWSEAGYNSASAPHGMFWTFVYNLINNYIAVETDKSFFQLGMSDNTVFCSCDQCTADVEKYGRSGVALRFANAVADEVEKWRLQNCPEREIYLTTFAYMSIVDPPTVKSTDENGKPVWTPVDPSVVARDNIVIRYAPISDYYLYPLLDEKNNIASYNAMNGWKAVATNFAVWDYRINFVEMLAPFPQWMSAYDNIKAYYDYGYIDVFHQGCRTFGNTSFVTIDNYVRSRLLWNVNEDYRSLMHEAISVYYDEAAPMMEEYLEYTTLHYMNYLNKEFGWKAHSHEAYINTKNFPRGYMLNVDEIFSRAYAAIEQKKDSDPERYELLKFRVDVESVPYRYLQLALYQSFYTKDELRVFVDEFAGIVEKAGILGMDTFGGMEEIIEGFRSAL